MQVHRYSAWGPGRASGGPQRPVQQIRHLTGSLRLGVMTAADPGRPGLQAEVSGGKGVLVGSGNEQVNLYVQTYIETQHLPDAPAQGRLVVGEVPQRARAFQPRAELVNWLGQRGPGVAVV